MRGCSPPITRADELRYMAFQEIGCICCRINGHPGESAEPHHIDQSDNQKTLPLCPWHHRGVPPQGISTRAAESVLGPSLARSRSAFESEYGTEEELLESVNKQVEGVLERELVA